jgi:hypothetical protein
MSSQLDMCPTRTIDLLTVDIEDSEIPPLFRSHPAVAGASEDQAKVVVTA